MLMNDSVVPIMALNRHLTLVSSRETVRYMDKFYDQWGYLRAFYSQRKIPVFYWRLWRAKANTVLESLGQTKPDDALVHVLEKWQSERKGKRFFGGEAISVVDLWLYGHISVARNESLFSLVISPRCGETMEWFSTVEEQILLRKQQ